MSPEWLSRILAETQDTSELFLSSYGGSGLNMLVDWAHQYRRTRTHTWELILCHYAYPPPIPVPTLCIVAHPGVAYASMVRRGLANLNTWKMLGDLPEDYPDKPWMFTPLSVAMLEYLLLWKRHPTAAIVKYEALWNHVEEVCDHLGLPADNFPVRTDRLTIEPEYPHNLQPLIDLYESLPDWKPSPVTKE